MVWHNEQETFECEKTILFSVLHGEENHFIINKARDSI